MIWWSRFAYLPLTGVDYPDRGDRVGSRMTKLAVIAAHQDSHLSMYVALGRRIHCHDI